MLGAAAGMLEEVSCKGQDPTLTPEATDDDHPHIGLPQIESRPDLLRLKWNHALMQIAQDSPNDVPYRCLLLQYRVGG